MEAALIDRSPQCLKHSFNGTLIALTKESAFANVVDDISTCQLINIYRNSSEPKSPCNISTKFVTPDGKLENRIYKSIYIDDYKEDPRVFVYDNQLYISYNRIDLDKNDEDTVKGVKIGYSKLDRDLNVLEEVTSFPIASNPWEKNWLFFEHHDSKLYIIYKVYK